MLQSKSLFFDSLWLLIARSYLPASDLRPYISGAVLSNALRSFSDAPWALWVDRIVASTLFLKMAVRAETESQRLAIIFCAVSCAAMLFRSGDRVLHHMFHYTGFVALLLIAGKDLKWVCVNTVIYWGGIFMRSSGAAVTVAMLMSRCMTTDRDRLA